MKMTKNRFQFIRTNISTLSIFFSVLFVIIIAQYASYRKNITNTIEVTVDLIAKGNSLYELGKYNESAKIYLEEISKNPNNAFAWANLGNTYRELGHFELSISSHRKAVDLTPDRPRSHYNLGVSLQTSNELIEAIESYKIAIQLDPSFLNAHYNMGLAYQELGELKLAMDSYKYTLQLDPYHLESRLNYCNILFAEQMIDIAERCYHDILTIHPQYTRAIVNVAALYHATSDHNQAMTYYKLALEIDPENSMALHSLAALEGHQIKQPNSIYIEQLFDSYSFHFESSLSKLEYRSPQFLAEALLHIISETSEINPTKTISTEDLEQSTLIANKNNDNNINMATKATSDMQKELLQSKTTSLFTSPVILDLGCGTGLMCPLLRNISHTMIGVDISSKMIAKAKLKDCYDDLVVSEINSYLLHSLDNTSFSVNIILAADVFVYFGELEEVFRLCNKLLQKSQGGYLAFTVESLDHLMLGATRTDDDDDVTVTTMAPPPPQTMYKILSSGRYAHSKQYINLLVSIIEDFEVTVCESIILRLNNNQPVIGYMVILLSSARHIFQK